MKTILYLLILASLSVSCASLKQQRLFVSDGDINTAAFDLHLYKANNAYVLQPFDRVAISVFPNAGEQTLNQTGDQLGTGGGNAGGGNAGGNQMLLNNPNQSIIRNNMPPNNYIIGEDGTIDLPVVGKVQLAGYTMAQADSALAKTYDAYVKDAYAVCQYLNKRVILIGALGDRVVNLTQENTSLMELLATALNGANSIQRLGRADRIKIIRGLPGSRSTLTVDLTTMSNFEQMQTNVQPNDIIYIEPRRRLDRETLGDISAIFTPILTALSFFTTIWSLTRK